MEVFSLQPFSVDDTKGRIKLIFVSRVRALHNLNSLPTLDLVGDCLPLEALGLQLGLQVCVDLELAFCLVVIKTNSDGGTVHVLPDVVHG